MATQYQIEVLEKKLGSMKPDPVTGKYDSKYYSLWNKIKNLKIELEKLNKRNNWNNFLAQ